MIYFLTGFLSLYVLTIVFFCFGFISLKTQNTTSTKPKTKFSVCIPFRNESKNLPALLESLANLNYPEAHFEILLINDHSTDDSTARIDDFCLKNADFNRKVSVLELKSTSAGGKKAALAEAISKASHPWILTTDADCILPKTWLSEMDTFIQQSNKNFIAGPVTLQNTNPYFLNAFQQLDFLSLQGATIGGFGLQKPILCNGANLAFAKAEFYRLNGYEHHKNVASGDDILLLQQFLQDKPRQVGFLKSREAIVQTQPQHSWKTLVEQRRRWTAKASHYTDLWTKTVSLLVFTANSCLIVALFYLGSNVLLMLVVFLKILADFLLIVLAARFYKKNSVLSAYLCCSLFYPFFTFFVGIYGQFGHFSWKGRRLKK